MELLTYTFVQYAFIGGIGMAVLAGVLGPFVVQSKQSIASDMFAHVALAGIGAALLVGVSPWWGALPALILVSTLIWWLLDSDSYSPDSLAMFFLSGGLALALALVHVAKDTAFAFENYLFGSILTLTTTDLVAIVSATVCVIGIAWYLWYPLLGATQHPRFLIPFRRTPQLVLLIYFWILAIVVWVGIKTIGGLLIGALFVIPVLTARQWVSSFKALVLTTTAVSVLSVVTGLCAALYVDLPPSSLIIGTLIVLFLVQLPFTKHPA
ncbi:metal ABC transporter permease [Candidatus Kaiserbacteria bacterium]|nr:metal ABC transporter permease [Candidatus Kaiserbacteria bacterium]MCB9812471.1 metal ABC transporter permease [Candidatus Nomurabacteria bacterium]